MADEKKKDSLRTLVEIKCREDIINLPDIATLRDLKSQWNIKSDSPLQTREDYIRLLLRVYDQSHERIQKALPDPNAGLMEALQMDSRKRAKLQEMYDEILGFYNSLPPQYQDNLNTAILDIVNTIAKRRCELDSGELIIMVTGDTGAGKSSFINLLLDIDILPVHAIETTQTICELRKSKNEEKEAVFHYKSGFRREGLAKNIINLDCAENIEELKTKIKERDQYESPFERIEIYMPFKMLQEGVVIVDSPGFGEHGKNCGLVERYLSRACGIIYVINTASAGGVDSGRIKDFLHFLINSTEDHHNPSATIFIGNKIDSIDARDRDEVKDTTYHKLKQCFPNLKDNNIFFMSVTEALQSVSYDTWTKEHENMIHGIQKLFPVSLRNRLSSHYKFQIQTLKDIIVPVQDSHNLALAGRNKNITTMKDVERRMNILEQNAKSTIQILKKIIRDEEDRLYGDIVSYLRSRTFTETVFAIEESESAIQTKDWKKVVQDANVIIGYRITEEINKWEKADRRAHGIKTLIMDKLKKDCLVCEKQLKEIEGAFFGVKDLQRSMRKQAPVREIWTKAKENQKHEENINSLGTMVRSAGVLSTKNKRVKEICKGYFSSKSPQQDMQTLIAIYIENIFDGNDLRININKFMSRFTKGVDIIERKIPEFLTEDARLIRNIQEDISEAEHNLNISSKILHQGKQLQGKLGVFCVQNIIEPDFSLGDISYNRSEDLIGSGSFANVYRATLVCYEPPLTVALKIRRCYLQENNVFDVLLEDQTMRGLNHRNIAHYYGATVREEKVGESNVIFWIMVLEHCTSNLHEKIMNENNVNPAKIGNKSSNHVEQMKDMANMVIEICDGLRYIYDKNMVHGNLKPANILISKNTNNKDIVKLSDVRLTNSFMDIGNPTMNLGVYTAPEVLLQTETHNQKSDIYSLAIIMWEMWYGIDAADHVKAISQGTLDSALKEGLRPSLSLEHKPPADWISLIENCWELDPNKRLEVDAVKTFFDSFLNHEI